MPLIIGGIFLVVVMSLFTLAAIKDWGGERYENEENAYCERISRGKIKQPINTWSTLGFIAAGLGILAYLTFQEPPTAGTNQNPMMTATVLSVLYGCLVIWLGPGSMFLHGSLKIWGGWLDNLSMNMFIGFVIWYDLTRALDGGIVLFLPGYLATVVIFGLLTWIISWKSMGILTFAILIVIAAVVEIWAGLSDQYSRQYWWLLGVAASFGAGLGVWLPSRTGQPWCKEDSILQGHAAWHLLSALAAAFIFVYLHSES